MKNWLLIIVLLFSRNVFSQQVDYARSVIEELCSEKMAGRGYVDEGDEKAANYIRNEFERIHLKAFPSGYRQEFGFPVISYPGKMDVSVDGIELIPGEEFIINPGCPAIKGKYAIHYVDSATIDNFQQFEQFCAQNFRNAFLYFDLLSNVALLHPERIKYLKNNKFNARGIIQCNVPNLVWSVSSEWADYPIISVKKERLKGFITELNLNIEARHSFHNTANLIAYIPGKSNPDSFIVFTAHYDHLGKMGSDTYFPGANDNAGGIAMLLDIAQYYSKHPPDFSIAFIAFAGEEIGLLGSYYYTRNPVFPLPAISTLINLDLVTTGDKGMTVVNASEYPDAFQKLLEINKMMGYLPYIYSRGKAQNSDHYFFSEAGVRSFFFYLMGDYHQYHDIHDEASKITLARYEQAFKLIIAFADRMQLPF